MKWLVILGVIAVALLIIGAESYFHPDGRDYPEDD